MATESSNPIKRRVSLLNTIQRGPNLMINNNKTDQIRKRNPLRFPLIRSRKLAKSTGRRLKKRTNSRKASRRLRRKGATLLRTKINNKTSSSSNSLREEAKPHWQMPRRRTATCLLLFLSDLC